MLLLPHIQSPYTLFPASVPCCMPVMPSYPTINLFIATYHHQSHCPIPSSITVFSVLPSFAIMILSIAPYRNSPNCKKRNHNLSSSPKLESNVHSKLILLLSACNYKVSSTCLFSAILRTATVAFSALGPFYHLAYAKDQSMVPFESHLLFNGKL
jgi:hypothetical protein